jgi:hypothetical protein
VKCPVLHSDISITATRIIRISADGVSLTALLQKNKKRFTLGSGLKQKEARLHGNGEVR